MCSFQVVEWKRCVGCCFSCVNYLRQTVMPCIQMPCRVPFLSFLCALLFYGSFFMVYRFDCCFSMFTLQPIKGLAQTKLMIFLLFLMVLVIFLMWRMYFSFLLLLWIMKNEQRTVYEMLCVARYMDYLIAVVVAAMVSAFECCGLCCGDDILACRLLCLGLDIGEVYLEMCRL